MLRAVAGNTARQDFPTLRYETTESGNILIVNVLDFIDTESANLLTGLPVPVTSDQSNPSSINDPLESKWDFLVGNGWAKGACAPGRLLRCRFGITTLLE